MTPMVTDDKATELKRLDMILQISTDLKSQELQDKFRWIVIDEQMMKAQVWAFNLDHPMVWATELVQHAKLLEEKQEWDDEVEEAEIVPQSLGHEVSQGVLGMDCWDSYIRGPGAAVHAASVPQFAIRP
jgi:hypothetical protein